ncbi:MAG: hypothetical protein ACXW2F_01370 [Thermoanaerobaculia bacterium]
MSKRTAIALFVLLIATSSAAAEIHGAWTATAQERGELHFFMTTGGWRNFGRTLRADALGLNEALLKATTVTPVTMRLERDAGIVLLEGTFKNGDGAGQFTFNPDRSYIATLKSMGLALEPSEGRSDEDELFTLAVIDVSAGYVRAMHDLYRDATLRDIRKARAVDVTQEYIAAIKQLGFELDDLSDATRLAAAGVTAEYVRSLRAAGVAVHDSREATRLRAVNVTPDFIADLANAGYKNLSVRDLTRLAAVGVNGRFIRDMARYGDKHR